MRIYIAGPYTPRSEHKHVAIREAAHNVHVAIVSAIKVLEKGHIPYVPHLTHYIHTNPECKREYNWYAIDDTILEHWAEALLYLGSSPGADHELELAKELGLRVFMSIDEIPDSEEGKRLLHGKTKFGGE